MLSRFVMLSFLIFALFVTFVFLAQNRSNSYVDNAYISSIGSLIVILVNILPIICHQKQKVEVRFIYIFIFVVLGGLLGIAKSYDLGIAVFVGGVGSWVQWCMELLVCTHQF